MSHAWVRVHNSDTLHAQIMDSLDDVIWSLSLPDLTPLYFNLAAARVYQCACSDRLIADNSNSQWLEAIAAEDRPKIKQAIAKAQELGSSQLTYHIQQPDGARRCFSARFKISQDISGNAIRLDAIANEISEISNYQKIEFKHKQTEEILLQSENRYRQVEQHHEDLILRSLADTTITFANDALCNLLGIELEQVVGKKWIEFADTDVLESILQSISNLSPANPSFIVINRDSRPDGQIGWIQWLNKGVFNEQGQLVDIQSSGRDVTDLKRSEIALQQLNEELELRIEQRTEALRQSESRNLAILHAFPDLLLLLKPDGRCVQCIMPSTEEKPKYLPIQQHISEVLSPETLAIQLKLYEKAIATGEIQIYEHQLSKFGKTVYEEVRIAPYCEDELLVVVRDITDRKLAEERLIKSDVHLKTAQRIGKVGSWEFDLQTGSIIWSEEIFRIFRLDPQIGTPSSTESLDFLHPDDREYVNQVFQNAISNAQPYELEYRINRADGTLAYISSRGEIVCDLTGKTTQIVGTVTDITDRKLAEQQLQDLTDRLTLALKSAAIGIWEWDTTNNCLIWDVRTYELYDVNPDLYTDAYSAWVSRVHPSDREFVENEARSALNGEKDYEPEFRIVLPDGSIRYLKAYSLVQRNDEGAPQRMIGINFDITNRKLAEVQLLKSDTHLKTAQRIGKLGSWEFEVSTGKLTWSDEVFRIYGLEPSSEPPSYEELQLYIHPEDWENFDKTVQAAINLGKSYDIEHRLIQPSGILIYVLARGEMVYNSSGQLTHVIGTAIDITDRKIAEQQLKNLTDRLTLAVKSAAIGIWEWNIKKNILIWDERMYQLYGVTPNQSPNNYLTWASCLHPDDRAISEAAVQQSLKGEKDFDIEFRIVLPDRSIRHLKAFALIQQNDAGEPQRMVGVNFDITDRKLAEAELNRSRDLREAIFNESTDALFLVNSQTLLTTDCNLRSMQMFEVSDKADLIGIEGHTLQQHQFSDEELAAISSELETTGFWSREVEYITHQGRAFWGNLAAKPITIAEQTINLVRVTDISDRKLAEAKILQTSRQLENTNRELESFCYSVSHDLRAPLRHMNGFVNALQQQLKKHVDFQDPKVDHYIQVINNSSQKMGHLIDGLLVLSRYGRRPLESKQISIRALVDATIEIISSDPHHNPSVEFAIGELPTTVGDPTLLQQVFQNLISNAVKFSRNRPRPYIEIDSLPDGTIRIKDNGAGFQMEYADKLFGVFQRLHNEKEFEGTGIGLAIVQRIVQRHGGVIWAEGYPDRGATFFLKI
ncbi:MAG: hypothetical protein DCF19_16685 [Pseudanabaena frigida]|uniref:histidine kinase n=1 Tax=Pseudanabaena frigida TaxID=945775 RepID=A0A2W4VZH0_9CYAN|nr:MAG: hypothetical protein DCF19_16685 [Pseudanabaena frigida]